MSKREEFLELRARHKAMSAATDELEARLRAYRDEPGFWHTNEYWHPNALAVPVEELSEAQLLSALRDAAEAAGSVVRDAPSLARDQLNALLDEAQRRRAPQASADRELLEGLGVAKAQPGMAFNGAAPEQPRVVYKHPSMPINQCVSEDLVNLYAEAPVAEGVDGRELHAQVERQREALLLIGNTLFKRPVGMAEAENVGRRVVELLGNPVGDGAA